MIIDLIFGFLCFLCGAIMIDWGFIDAIKKLK